MQDRETWGGYPPGDAAKVNGWHWVASVHFPERLVPAAWDAHYWTWWAGEERVVSFAARNWRYLGPCMLPDEVRATVRTARRKALDEARVAAMRACFGPPSHWPSDRPVGWHLDRPCTPEEASMHDNGCIDAARVITTLRDDPCAGA